MRLLLLFGLLIGLARAAAAQAEEPAGRPADGLLRRPALRQVVDLQVARDGEALARLLEDADPARRARAAFALASVQAPAAASALARALDDPDAGVRADAAFALGQAADSAAAGALLDRLAREPEPAVRPLLLEALGKTGGRASLDALIALPAARDRPADLALAVARYGLRGVFAPGAVRLLAELLASDDPRTRRNAAYFFGRARSADPWRAEAGRLRAALDAYAPGDEAAMHLAAALGRLNEPQDLRRLLHLLRTATDWRTRVNAARALAPRAAELEAAAGLVDALDDPSEHVAVAVAEALATGSIPAELLDRLDAWTEAHPERWRVAAPLLRTRAARGDEAFVLGWLARHGEERTPAFARGLAALAEARGPGTFLLLAASTRAGDPQVAAAALGALSARWTRERADEAVRPAYYAVFAHALRRRDLATAALAAPVLADTLLRPLGAASLLQEVYAAMRTPEEVEPMIEVLRALGAAGDASAAPLLRRALAHPYPVIRQAAADALRALTGEAVSLPPAENVAERRVDWAALARFGDRPRLVLETEKGLVRVALAPEEAPLTVQTILQLAAAGRYDGVPFHRVVPNFVVQGGDFERGDGYGGPGFSIRSEFTRIPYERGTIGMASAGKDTEGSQYFVTHSVQPHLDGRYTAFGRVLEGLDVVDRLYEGDRVIRARVE